MTLSKACCSTFAFTGSQASSLEQQANITEELYTLLTTKNVFCKRKMKMSLMTIGEGQNDTLQFQTKNFNNNRDFKRAANDKKDNFVQKQMGSSKYISLLYLSPNTSKSKMIAVSEAWVHCKINLTILLQICLIRVRLGEY